MSLPRSLLAAATLACSFGHAATALEAWQLAHGPFVTAADVRAHNGLGQDIADIRTALADEDFRTALSLYAFGANFPWRDTTHSLGRFADDYNRAMPRVVPKSVAFFGYPTFQNTFMVSALAGTGRFQGTDPTTRIAAVEAGALGVTLNWTRFELVMSRTKALANSPNWALSNGSPKNWNEIFAFHWGPEGRHALHEAVAALPGGDAMNAALLDALAAGQERLLREEWAEEEGAVVADLLDGMAMLLFTTSIERAAGAPDGDLAAARMAAAGFWLAAAETVLTHDPDAAVTIEDAFLGAPDRSKLEAARRATAAVASRLASL